MQDIIASSVQSTPHDSCAKDHVTAPSSRCMTSPISPGMLSLVNSTEIHAKWGGESGKSCFRYLQVSSSCMASSLRTTDHTAYLAQYRLPKSICSTSEPIDSGGWLGGQVIRLTVQKRPGWQNIAEFSDSAVFTHWIASLDDPVCLPSLEDVARPRKEKCVIKHRHGTEETAAVSVPNMVTLATWAEQRLLLLSRFKVEQLQI